MLHAHISKNSTYTHIELRSINNYSDLDQERMNPFVGGAHPALSPYPTGLEDIKSFCFDKALFYCPFLPEWGYFSRS
jgi:hypothetical protein